MQECFAVRLLVTIESAPDLQLFSN